MIQLPGRDGKWFRPALVNCKNDIPPLPAPSVMKDTEDTEDIMSLPKSLARMGIGHEAYKHDWWIVRIDISDEDPTSRFRAVFTLEKGAEAYIVDAPQKHYAEALIAVEQLVHPELQLDESLREWVTVTACTPEDLYDLEEIDGADEKPDGPIQMPLPFAMAA